ncbi:MAG TPA: hypothetical protein VK892_13095 [Pyrinomonadaceae bacterium]|nr:hypothetical protein [Pyrinomonadaceae bacterium]
MQERENSQSNESNELNKAGDPGSTPDTAEGDRETVEADLKEKEREGFFEKNKKSDK